MTDSGERMCVTRTYTLIWMMSKWVREPSNLPKPYSKEMYTLYIKLLAGSSLLLLKTPPVDVKIIKAAGALSNQAGPQRTSLL